MSDYINDHADSSMRATIISGISLISSIANTGWKIALGLVIAGFSFPAMLNVQAGYLFIGALFAYWLLVRCGCVYKIEHRDN